MVSTHSLISKSSSPFIYLLVTELRAPITIGINVTFMFHSFFNSLVRSKYLSLFSLSFNFILWSARTAKSTILQVLSLFFFFFFVDYYKVWLSSRDKVICLDVKIPEEFVSFSRIDVGLCICLFFVWPNLNFLHNSQWITLPTQSSLLLYSFCANLLHSLYYVIDDFAFITT